MKRCHDCSNSSCGGLCARAEGSGLDERVSVPSEDLLHPGPNIGRGLRTLFELIHGGADAGR